MREGSARLYALSTVAFLLSSTAWTGAWGTTTCNITFSGQTSCVGSTTNATTGCLTLGSSLPDSITGSATGLNGPSSSSATANTVAIETAILDANLAFGTDSTANCTITLPASGFYYLTSYCPSSQSTICATGPTVTLFNGSVSSTATLPVENNAILDVSSYSSTHGTLTPVPLRNLKATSTGHLTIAGASGTSSPVFYTDNNLEAIVGVHTNHVTFENITLNRPIYEETEGTITAISTTRTMVGGLTVLPYVTISTPPGFRFADATWEDDENYIVNSPGSHVARYMRLYSASSLELLPDVVGAVTNANLEEGWGEAPSSYNTQSVCATLAGSQWDAHSSTCEVQPSATAGAAAGTAPCTATACNIYIKDTQLPSSYVLNAFVCLKSKMSGPYSGRNPIGSSIGYGFTGPWDSVDVNGNPLEYGGFDVSFQNVTWVQQAYGRANYGFRAFNVVGSTIMRAPPPQSGSPAQCLSDGNGGPQLGGGGVNDAESDYQTSGSWPPTVVASSTGTTISTISVISGLTATATGDDTIALFNQNSTSATLSNNVIL